MTVSAKSGRIVNVDGVGTFVHEQGEGHPVVLIHGAGPGASGLSNWSRNIAALARNFRVITVDLPGFGRSDKVEIPPAFFEYYGLHLGKMLDAMGIESAHMVGNSLGGGASMMLALRRPEKVAKMVLMGPGGGFPVSSVMPTAGLKMIMGFYQPPGPSRERLSAFVKEMVVDQSAITDELIEQRYAAATAPDVIDCPPFGFRNGRPPVPDDVWRERLNTLPHKTLIIWGREDRVMPLDNGFILMKQIPEAQLHVMPNCGHWAQWEKADEFNALVELFLRG
jgi:4,5:9,10-diseco-3-hydroxy-5,9,17-trioxoandrosta-1(10),2-diene-4-oate hydrolase